LPPPPCRRCTSAIPPDVRFAPCRHA
jgi:hypothetical protein